MRAAVSHGTKRLNVSVPAYCELMRDAQHLLRQRLAHIEIKAPKTNWFSNQTANTMGNPSDVKDALADQMTHGMRWVEFMEKFSSYNIARGYELGPGKTLTHLINRANVGCRAFATDKVNNIYVMLNDIRQMLIADKSR